MPPKAGPLQKNNILSYWSRTPSQPTQNAAFAPSPAAPSTIQETPTTRLTTDLDPSFSSIPSPSSRSPSPTAPRDLTAYDGATEPPRSSLPQSSGNSTTTSKRTFSQGKPVVLNSDSDSDPLSDLDDLLNDLVAKPKATTRAATAQMKEPKASVLPQPPKRLKNDDAFRRLVQAAQKNAKMEQEIAQVQAELDKPEREHPPERDAKISEDMVADAVHDENDPEKAKKLYLAMQRTNALQVDYVFHFFDRESDDRTATKSSFPISSLPRHQIASIFEDPLSRDQAFLSGFARQLFRREIPEELVRWIIDEVCINESEALNQRYLELLSAHQNSIQNFFDSHKLEKIFDGLGAAKQYTRSSSEITLSHELQGRSCALPKTLISVCKLLQLPAPRLRTEARIQALQTLLLICMDDRVQMDNAVLQVVQETIESLIRPIPSNDILASVLDHVLSDLILRVKHPILQRNLVSVLPTRSPLTASFQRHLALSFLLCPTTINQPLGSPENLNLIHAHLQKSPHFRIKKDTDYAVLAARFTLLDVAIGPGPLAVPYQPLTSPVVSQESQGFSLVAAPAPPSDEVRTFNKEVDAFAQRLRLIGNGINVAGAITDLSRLAANDCCDRLCTRLEHVVRIGGRKMKNIFSKEEEEEEEEERSRATFKKWLDRKKTEPSDLDETLASEGASNEVAFANSGGEGNNVAVKPERGGNADVAKENTRLGATTRGVKRR